MNTFRIIEGDALAGLGALRDGSAQTCVTSPPYFGLRDYGAEGQIGLEDTPELYVTRLVEVFREVHRVLRDDGTAFLNLGDSYAGSGKGGNPEGSKWKGFVGKPQREAAATAHAGKDRLYGLKPKDLIGVPWMVAFALRADGWYLRQEIIWHKPNPMPESVTDRCTKAHEQIFLLAKSPRYYYDAGAIAETAIRAGEIPGGGREGRNEVDERVSFFSTKNAAMPVSEKRNKRSVWTVAPKPYPGAHFATFPTELITPCVLAGSKEGDTVLDPFAGSGTTGVVALRHNRNFVGCELNPSYCEMARKRIYDDSPMFNREEEAA
jgi:DNA modification methylase